MSGFGRLGLAGVGGSLTGSLHCTFLRLVLVFGIGSGGGRQYPMFDSEGKVDAVYIGEINLIRNAIFEPSAIAMHDAVSSKKVHWFVD